MSESCHETSLGRRAVSPDDATSPARKKLHSTRQWVYVSEDDGSTFPSRPAVIPLSVREFVGTLLANRLFRHSFDSGYIVCVKVSPLFSA